MRLLIAGFLVQVQMGEQPKPQIRAMILTDFMIIFEARAANLAANWLHGVPGHHRLGVPTQQRWVGLGQVPVEVLGGDLSRRKVNSPVSWQLS